MVRETKRQSMCSEGGWAMGEAVRASVEELETRWLKAAPFVDGNGCLTIEGTANDDDIVLNYGSLESKYYISITTDGVKQSWEVGSGGVRSILISALGGDDKVLTTGAVGATINGGDGEDELSGTQLADSISGDDGYDKIWGNAGADAINGGSGNDTAWGGDGVDVIHGGDGDDEIHGDDHGDWLWGDGGADIMSGGDGSDEMSGGDGPDAMDGDGGSDTMHGNGGMDTMHGDNFGSLDTPGTDVVYGDMDPDTIYGGGNNDSLYGGDGGDHVYGDNGNDLIDLGPGGDYGFGGNGDDTFESTRDGVWDSVNGGSGYDSIMGFDREGDYGVNDVIESVEYGTD